jgi:hypothetical protein
LIRIDIILLAIRMFPPQESWIKQSIYELGVGWVQSTWRIPFETLRDDDRGRKAYVIGDYVQSEVELMQLVSDFFGGISFCADDGDIYMGMR